VKGPTEEDLNRTNHEAPQEDGVAWERHNFNLEELCRDGRKLGFLITQTRPLSFKDGEGIVFFASRLHRRTVCLADTSARRLE